MEIVAKREPYKDKNTGQLWIDISLSNNAIRFIKFAVESYKGDKDDKKMEKVREDVHELWKVMNPS